MKLQQKLEKQNIRVFFWLPEIVHCKISLLYQQKKICLKHALSHLIVKHIGKLIKVVYRGNIVGVLV